nr:MAG TPA: N-6 DNA Methylase [Caudoviricetes sp.]
MTILDCMMKALSVRELHEIPGVLMDVLLDHNKLERLIANMSGCYSYSGLLQEFEEKAADRKNYMQDYTPQSVMDIVAGISTNGCVRDVCAGIGGLSLAKYKNNPDVVLQLEEYSKNAICFLLFNLVMNRVPAVVIERNVLTKENIAKYKVEISNQAPQIIKEVCIDECTYSADTIISNPPYSLSWVPVNDERFDGYKLAPKSKADYAFILDGIYSLKNNGTAVFILPHGVLFRGQAEGDIRENLIKNNLLDAVIGLPSNLFTNTGIPVCILVFKKNRVNKDILFIDAQKDFVKDKSKNIMTSEHVLKVIDTYNNRSDIEKYSRKVSISEIEENDYNLNIPRYIDSFEPEEIPDAVRLAKELSEINRESRTLGLEIAEMLKQLVCTDPDAKKEHDEFVKEFTEFLISSESACTIEEQEAVIKK